MKDSKGISTAVALIAAIIVTAVVVGAGTWAFTREEGAAPAAAPAAENKLLMYHWWTAGGEKEAIDNCIATFEDETDVKVTQNPAAGGGGGVMRATVKSMIAAGQPPDTFQLTYGTGMAKSYSEYLQPMDKFFTEEVCDAMCHKIEEWGKVDGHHYLMPLNMHTNNNLWYNKDIIEEAGVDMPLKNFDEFLNACEKVKDVGYTPLALGTTGAQKFWHLTLFNAILAREDREFLRDYLVNGKINPADSEEIRLALEDFKKLFTKGYVNEDYSALSWDEAGDLLVEGKAAFNVMGDWQKGHLQAKGLEPGVDFGRQVFPGGQGKLLIHFDSFGVAKGAPHPQATEKWIEFLSTTKAETSFCPIKGASPPRKDAPLAPYDSMQKESIKDFRGEETVLVQSSFAGPLEGFMAGEGTVLSSLAAGKDLDWAISHFDSTYKEVFGE